MAHTRTTNKDARLLEQLARGRRTRYTAQQWIQIADDRAADDADSSVFADVIRNQTVAIPLFIAPCAGKIVRCGINATQYVTIASSTCTMRFLKAVIGGTDVELDTGTTSIGAATAPTAETAIDATLSVTSSDLDLIEGQLVYCNVVTANQDITAKSLGMVLFIEFCPTDTRD
ncbi:MAG: hypothetical protein Q7R49_05655 [Candidatus Daviesbacteria bacterium]|nr:hypothetical protein [Candidatus Daviesbacteria bacterium]